MTQKSLKMMLGVILAMGCLFTSCKDDDPAKSTLTGITSFGFVANEAIPGLENIAFTIDQTTHTITNEDALPYQADVSALVAKFEAIAKTHVAVGQTAQISEETANDFSKPVMYNVTAEDGVTSIDYTVNVKISDVNPEGVSWVKEHVGITNEAFQTSKSVYFNGKYHAIFGTVENKVAAAYHYVSTDGKSWTMNTYGEDEFPLGSDHELVVFKNKLYILGNQTMTPMWGMFFPGSTKTIYSSDDGMTWEKEANTYTFDNKKIRPNVFSMESGLYVVGGNINAFYNYEGSKDPEADAIGPAGLSLKISSSTDGLSWTDHTEMLEAADSEAGFEGPSRRYSANVVHDNKMYMIGGQIMGGYISDQVWSSTDGLTWTKVETTGLSKRMGAAAISYDGKIWLVGGQTNFGVCTNELLVSADNGATWTPVEEDAMIPAEFSARAGHSMFLDANNKVWIVGGYTLSTTQEEDDNGDMKDVEVRTNISDVWSGKLNKL